MSDVYDEVTGMPMTKESAAARAQAEANLRQVNRFFGKSSDQEGTK